MFYAVKNLLNKVKEKMQKVTSTTDLDQQTEEQISVELIQKREERKEEKNQFKSKLLAMVEADNQMQGEIKAALQSLNLELGESGKRMNRLLDIFEEYIETKKKKSNIEK